jgi:hypothetical protein
MHEGQGRDAAQGRQGRTAHDARASSGHAVQAKHGHGQQVHDKPEREETTCGHEMARDAEVPELLARLFGHVAENMVVHGQWVQRSSESGADEERGLQRVAEHYRAMAAAGQQAAAAMRAMEDVPPAPHDLALLDRVAFAQWMRTKVQLQRKLAHLLLNHAEHSESVLRRMDQSSPELPPSSPRLSTVPPSSDR